MIKVLFLIHDLGEGGAEKVLINLINNMDYKKFDITVMTLFDVGVNRQFLNNKVHYSFVYKNMLPGNSHLMKLATPRQLHRWYIKDHYDVEIAYLEGPCARIISGCSDSDTKLVTWIHREQFNAKIAAQSFRSVYEAEQCYNKFDRVICVSKSVKEDFLKCLNIKVQTDVMYNTNETDKIKKLSCENIIEKWCDPKAFKLVGVGKLLKSKGFDRLLRISKGLLDEGYKIHTYILGMGPEEENLKKYIADNNLENSITLLGYQTNPYKFVKNCDLFVCTSFAEGFSTATTEALIVGVPVCTVEVSGMKEMLGDNNEYGIVTENTEDALFSGIQQLLDSKELYDHYKVKAEERGKAFSTANTVKAVEKMLVQLSMDC